MPNITIDDALVERVNANMPYQAMLPDNGCRHDSVKRGAYKDGGGVAVHASCDRCRAGFATKVEATDGENWAAEVGGNIVWFCAHIEQGAPCSMKVTVTPSRPGRKRSDDSTFWACDDHAENYL